MASQRPSSTSSFSSSSAPASKTSGSPRPPPKPARPSASIILLSPTNEVLLLHRVATSSAFPSAHVFPGGNLDAFHDGIVPPPDSPERHRDGPAYRMAAVRECFEESGILLARRDGDLVSLPAAERDAARTKIHGNEVAFGDFLQSIGAVADTDGLIPWTRWITPTTVPKRFTTQMYLYLLPISRGSLPPDMLLPTSDNGIEHTSALFAPPQTFLARAASHAIVIFPPQVFLLSLLTDFLTGGTSSLEEGPLHYMAQRKELLAFLRRVPTAETARGRAHETASIAWANKVVSPHKLFLRESDGRVVLGLDKPGRELEGEGRGGDWERVVLVKFGKKGPTDVEIRRRQDVLGEEKKSLGKL